MMRRFVVLALSVTVGFAQDGSRPAFEVASVKAAPAGAKASIRRDPQGGVAALGVTLKTLIQLAYKVQGYQLFGWPGWIDQERYDVIGKAGADARRDQTWDMMRTLLEERFRLVARRETREMPEFALLVAKNGPKFQEATRAPSEADGSFSVKGRRLTVVGAPVEYLTYGLSDVVGRRVLDETGIKGNFDLQVEWGVEPDGPSIFVALQEQLGLRLEARKGPVGVVVVEHVEKPSAN